MSSTRSRKVGVASPKSSPIPPLRSLSVCAMAPPTRHAHLVAAAARRKKFSAELSWPGAENPKLRKLKFESGNSRRRGSSAGLAESLLRKEAIEEPETESRPKSDEWGKKFTKYKI